MWRVNYLAVFALTDPCGGLIGPLCYPLLPRVAGKRFFKHWLAGLCNSPLIGRCAAGGELVLAVAFIDRVEGEGIKIAKVPPTLAGLLQKAVMLQLNDCLPKLVI